MLLYFDKVTWDLLSCCVMCCLLYAGLSLTYGNKGRRCMQVGVIAGTVGALVMGLLKQTTKLIMNSQVNRITYGILTVLGVIFIVFTAVSCRRGKGVCAWIACVTGALLAITLIITRMYVTAYYPFNFNIGDNTVLSWEFGRRFLGWLLPFVLLYLMARFMGWCVRQLNRPALTVGVLDGTILITVAQSLLMLLRRFVQSPKKWPYLKSSQIPWASSVGIWVENNSQLFMLAITAVSLILPVVLFISSMKVTEPYDNPAQHRKLKARGRSRRRRAVITAVWMAMAVLCVTTVHAYNNR